MPLISTLGAMSSRGFGEFAQQTAANYIEDVFSTYLYTGNGSTQTITNGIDLSGKGGLVWIKARNQAYSHNLIDTARGSSNLISSNDTGGNQFVAPPGWITFLSSGFTDRSFTGSGDTYASWTFRKQPKFFDVVTYTGDGVSGRTVSHNLGSTPGFIITKRTDVASNWLCYHTSLGFGAGTYTDTNYIVLNSTSASNGFGTAGVIVSANSTTFSPGASANFNGGTYVAYLFAHNAGGFGADGSQNVISCGSYTGNGSSTGPIITLGYEPQWLLIKKTSAADDWILIDNMRGFFAGGATKYLNPNTSSGESTFTLISPLPTGFQPITTDSTVNTSGATYIYMAIRRGPMRTPTSGTSVFSPVIWTGNDASNRVVGTLNSVDLMFNRTRTTTTQSWWVTPRLTNGIMSSDLTSAEASATPYLGFAVQSGVNLVSPTAGNVNASPFTSIGDMFCRAPGFFDVVCFTTSNSTNQRITHNLGVAPELIITKNRGSSGNWFTYAAPLGRSKYLSLNGTAASNGFGNDWGTSDPTSTDFGYNTQIFQSSPYSGNTVVAYLFATCPGVSKVGSYTGTGATQTINCGFTGGARYVLIKRTDSTGDWWVWDTARGMVAGTDPRLAYNSTAAETNANWVYTTTGGFQIVTSDATVNASGGSYIYLAIA